jgi:hypothetical protein
MKIIKINIIAFCSIIILLSNSCKKEATPGPAGKDGVANISSTLFLATSWAWSSPYHYVNFNVPDLTSSNINSSAVMVYFNVGGSWIAAPYAQYNSPYNYFMGFNTSVGKVQVTWFYDTSLSSGDNPNTFYGTTVNFKVVIIPPAVFRQHPNVDLKNYALVKETFNLKD